MADFILRYGSDLGNTEGDLFDVETVETANPFGDYAVCKIDDTGGQKWDEYQVGTQIQVEIDEPPINAGYGFDYGSNYGSPTITDFTGFVVERREVEQNGADQLEVEAYTFDQFLRRNTVSNDQSGNTITEALEDIVTTDSPVSWDASNVTVEDEQELTVSLRGEKVETALLRLAFLSGNEDFGVNASLEFYFRQQESGQAERGIDNTQWFNYDIPEIGKETVNEVEVFYANGDRSVIVDNGANKKTLQNNLGLPKPATRKEEISRPFITELEDARTEGERWLQLKNTTLTGEITTFGLYNAVPGEVLPITIDPRGIDSNFRIAAIQRIWGEDTTNVTAIENTEQSNNEVLVRLTEAVKRLETEDADRDGTTNRITSSEVGVDLVNTARVGGSSVTSSTVATNAFLNEIRNGWIGISNPDISTVVIGTGSGEPTREDTSLGNQTDSSSATESLVNSNTVEYEASFTASDITEIGLLNSSGDLLVRSVLDNSVDLSSENAGVRIEVTNNSDVELGVITDTGKTAIRNIIADNSPNTPTDYAYGSDTTDPSESDTSLGDQQISIPLDELLVQSADNNADWSDITDISDTDPLEITGGELKTLQTCFPREAEDFDRDNDSTSRSRTDYSDGFGRGLSDEGEWIEWDFTLGYDIPENQFTIFERYETSGNVDVTYYLDGTQVGTNRRDTGTVFTHDDLSSELNDWNDPGVVEAGEHTIRIEVTNADGSFHFADVVSPADNRFPYTLDNSVHQNDGYLDGPEEKPDLVEVLFSEVSTRRNLDAATAEQTWNDTSNDQKIELSNDGGSTWITTNNNSTATASFSGATNQLQTRVGISRWSESGARSQTPRFGYTAQSIDIHELYANIQAITPNGTGIANIRAIVSPDEITSTTIAEGGELDTNGDLLTSVSFAEFVKEAGQRLVSSENVRIRND